jgi:hypothetical protein
MVEDVSRNRIADWLEALRAIVTSATGIITALTALVVALGAFIHFWFPTVSSDDAAKHDKCIAGYVWREATSDDHVCVSVQTHEQTLQDNMLAGSRRDPRGGPYGADTCLSGFVWRDSFEGDHVCVTPETRSRAVEDNREGPNRVAR